MLQQDNRIGSLFIKHFIETNSHSSQTSALILFIKDKMLVEFSDTGALYVYKHNHSQVKMVLQCRGRIDSTNDLKIPSLDSIIEANYWGDYDFHEEGKMHHRGDWVSRLTRWMNEILLSKEIFFSPFIFDKKAEELFKANPAPIETIKITKLASSEEVGTTQENLTQVSSSATKIINNTKISQNNFLEEKVLEQIPINTVSNIIAQHIKVISNNDGFYLYNEEKKKFILLKHLTSSDQRDGKLLIFEARMQNWYVIVHSKNGIMKTIGYIKETKHGNGFLFKEKMEIAAKRRLKF